MQRPPRAAMRRPRGLSGLGVPRSEPDLETRGQIHLGQQRRLLRADDSARLRNTLAAVGAEAGSLSHRPQAATPFGGQLGKIPFPDIEAIADDHDAMQFLIWSPEAAAPCGTLSVPAALRPPIGPDLSEATIAKANTND